MILGATLAGHAQTLLTIEVDNYVPYHIDVSDPATFASKPGITPAIRPLEFNRFEFIGDIRSVNGQPAKGIWTATAVGLSLSPTPAPKQAIADAVRANLIEMYFDLMQADGTPIGTIMATGLTRGTPPPGAPLVQTGDTLAIVGGTGPFLGLRGQAGMIDAGSPRQASAVEDPANRRINGGATRSYVLHLIPMTTPEIVALSTGPAIVHSSDNSPVTATKPARAGEVLTLYATGLGPTRPGLDPGKPFPATGVHVVNSPTQIMVNGTAVPVMFAGGYPGTVNGYQVNFRLPDGTALGLASVSLNVGWINGSEVKIPVSDDGTPKVTFPIP
ncbi:MAG TPA: hypothetical protein VKE70_09500 [Candidatus Solibacter sp.]|nr:hypothetical protein [Candidatus Solibacter sp.]